MLKKTHSLFVVILFLGIGLIASTSADWVPNGMLNVDPNQSATAPDIATGNNTPYVVWSEQTSTGKKQIYVKKNNTITWVPASGTMVSLNADPNESADTPRIATYNSTPYVCWAESKGDTTLVYAKYLNGTSWQYLGGLAQSLNVDANRSAQYPAIAMDSSTPYITWREHNGIAYQIYEKHWNGNGWQQDGGSLNLDGNVDGYFSNIKLINADAYVTWVEDNKIYVKKLNGTNWEQLGGWLNNGIAYYAYNPVITQNNNTPYVSWSGTVLGNKTFVQRFENNQWIQEGAVLNVDQNRNAYPGDIKANNNALFVYAKIPLLLDKHIIFVMDMLNILMVRIGCKMVLV